MSGGAGKPWFGRLLEQLLRIRVRLLIVNLVIVMVPAVGLEWARTFEREALRALEQDMRHQAQILRTILEHNLDEAGRPRLDLAQGPLVPLAQRTRTRVRILDRAGRVLVDSHAHGPPEGPEPPRPTLLGGSRAESHRAGRSTDPGPLDGRSEIRAARRGELGTATRVHEHEQRVFLFVALPVMVKHRVEAIVYLNRSTTPVLESLYRLRTRLMQVLAIALAFTVLTTLFLAATISRPLARLTAAAVRLAHGDRSAQLHLERRDEIGALARSFAALVQQLDARARYVAEFAANISHEFKTPLASIRGAAELLVDQAGEDPAARQRFLANILADSARLDRLVTRILELSRLEATLEPREELEVAELLREAAERFAPHPIELRLAFGELRWSGHRAHLLSALLALLENAVRYSPPDQPVVIAASLEGEATLVISVEDHGPGISAGNQRKVFERFFTTERERGGTGLGLALVQTVAKAHGGDVRLVGAPGAGCRFELRLPRPR